jgi:glycosyltransferase involved in cell wall biosynthesis
MLRPKSNIIVSVYNYNIMIKKVINEILNNLIYDFEIIIIEDLAICRNRKLKSNLKSIIMNLEFLY